MLHTMTGSQREFLWGVHASGCVVAGVGVGVSIGLLACAWAWAWAWA
jgi:hypothetical protein